MDISLVPRPYQPQRGSLSVSRAGGGSGDFCHVSVFSAGIRAEPLVLQTVILRHAIIQ